MVKRYLMKKAAKRLLKKKVKKKVASKARTSAQKAALKKAVAASAKKRAGKGGAKKIVSKRVTRKANKIAARKKAIAKTESLNLKRVSKGTTLKGQRRISTSNFKGAKGKALKKSTYKARLASSRAKYKTSSLKNRAGQKAIGLVSPTGVWRRKYVDLTTGENVRRNISRSLKVAAPAVAFQAALVSSQLKELERNTQKYLRK